MQNEEFSEIRECACCFINETVVSNKPTRTATLYFCDYCKERPWLETSTYKQTRLERILSIMHKTKASQFPNIIRLMYDVLNKRMDKDE